MRIDLDRSSATPLREQIAGHLRAAIGAGNLAPGQRLPSSRELAAELGVNRATVVDAYRELLDAGLLEAGVGRGTYVRGPGGEGRASPDVSADEPFAWGRLLPEVPSRAPEPPRVEGGIPLSHAVTRADLFPLDALRGALRRAHETLGGRLLEYASAAGHEPLRAALADRFRARGIDMDRNAVVIVNGSQQGLDLVARLLLGGGRRVAVSRPAFAGALDVFRWHGASFVTAPVDGEGIDSRALPTGSRRPRLLYVIPRFHNPTGVSLSEERRDRLLDYARRERVAVLEDDWLGDLAADEALPPLKADDARGQIVYLGTASKVLVPGLRVGWLVVPKPMLSAVLALKRLGDLCTNLPGQAVLHELLVSGDYDRHARRLAVELEARRRIVDETIDRVFPEAVRPLRPHAGLVCWLRLPWAVDSSALLRESRREGLVLASGRAFDPGGQGALTGLRIAYGRAERNALGPALERLGGVLETLLARGPQPVAPPLV